VSHYQTVYFVGCDVYESLGIIYNVVQKEVL